MFKPLKFIYTLKTNSMPWSLSSLSRVHRFSISSLTTNSLNTKRSTSIVLQKHLSSEILKSMTSARFLQTGSTFARYQKGFEPSQPHTITQFPALLAFLCSIFSVTRVDIPLTKTERERLIRVDKCFFGFQSPLLNLSRPVLSSF